MGSSVPSAVAHATCARLLQPHVLCFWVPESHRYVPFAPGSGILTVTCTGDPKEGAVPEVLVLFTHSYIGPLSLSRVPAWSLRVYAGRFQKPMFYISASQCNLHIFPKSDPHNPLKALDPKPLQTLNSKPRVCKDPPFCTVCGVLGQWRITKRFWSGHKNAS